MLKKLTVALSLVAIAAIAACGGGSGGGGGGGGGDPTACGTSTQGCALGQVVDGSATPVALTGVSVKAAGAAVGETTGNGWFSASGIEGGSEVTLCFEKTGYTTICRNFTVTAQKTLYLPSITMIAKHTEVNVDNIETGGVAVDPDGSGAEVTFGAGTVCDSDGTTPTTGTISCSLTPITDVNQAPGDFIGVDAAGNEVPIVSGAMMDISCVDDVDAPVQLCEGKTATVKIPMLAGSDCATLDDMDSWVLDESTGKWEIYDTFTKVCGATNYYGGLINHMSWWNADRPEHFSCLSGTVVGLDGTSQNDYATVECSLSDSDGGTVRLKRSAQTGADGSFCVSVVRGSYYSCVAKKGANVSTPVTGQASSDELTCSGTSTSGCTNIGTLSVANPIFMTTLSWGTESATVPRDLDSHFISSDGTTQVYYMDPGSLATSPYVALDFDFTNWVGPENTSVVEGVTPGKYRFCVNNFSAASGADIANSAAVVRVTGSSSSLPRVYEVPTSPTGHNLWQVYEVTIGSDNSLAITNINQLVTAEYPTDATSVKEACLQ